jgi:hypothetical protein
MEDLENVGNKGNQRTSFYNHVFNFDDNTKSELLNILQYSVLCVVPIVLLNKSIKKFIPEIDDSKGSLEIILEIIAQIAVMFIGFFYIDRLVTFVPTYSQKNYENYFVTHIIIGTLVIVLSLQTKLGEKVNILVDRFLDFINGEQPEQVDKNGKPVKKEQQQGGQQQNHFPTPERATLKSEPNVNYDSMHAQTTTPMVNPNAPPQNYFPGESELMAANEALGGSFGSMF